MTDEKLKMEKWQKQIADNLARAISKRDCSVCKHMYVDIDEWCHHEASDHPHLGMRRVYEARYPGQPCGPDGQLFEPKSEDKHAVRSTDK